MNTTKHCFIGIDPAFRKSGFAICIIDEDNTVDFKKFKGFLEFLDWIWDAPQNGVYCVENSNLQDVTFDMKGSKGVIAKKSRSVGKNQAISQCVFDVLVKMKLIAYEVSPAQKGAKKNDKQIRWLMKHYGHTEISNYKGNEGEQDERDAYQLACIGMELFKKQSKNNEKK